MEFDEFERNDAMVTVNARNGELLSIGRRGENGVVRVAFDLKAFLAANGEGTPFLAVVRPGEEMAYGAPLTRDGDMAYWEITAEWTTFCGTGYCQLSWFVGERLAKSELFAFSVADSLDPPMGRISTACIFTTAL
jgi:hypothetical protein